MKISQLKNSEKFVLIFWLIPFLSSYLFINENISRFIVILLFLVFWIVLYLKSKDRIGFSLLYILLVSAFNITFTPVISDICYKNGVWVNYLCPTFHIMDIFLILAVTVFISENLNNLKKLINENLKLFLPLILFSIFYFILHNSLNEVINYVRIVIAISLLLLNRGYIFSMKENFNRVGKKILYSFIFVLLIQSIISLFQFTLGRDLNLQFLGESNLLSGSINSSFISLSFGEFLRGYGTFPHPNVLAGFALALSLLSIKFYEKKDIYIVSLLLLSLFISILSFSRLHIFLSIIVLIYYSLKNTKLLAFNFFPLLFERFSSFNLNSTSVIERVRLFNEGISMLKDRWLLGVGGGEFTRYLSNDIRTVSNISLFQPVHNSILLLFVEYGVFGITTLLYYLTRIFLYRKKSLLEILIIILILISISMFDHYLISLPQGIIILLMLLV